ncbi:MAG: guanosine-3',5'-bis(diphosphate) 3'-diphosphatase [Gammaproteobacteria bacterium]|nr:MAG: guanosine-3',5'-bis(diphosphate) 3'-diphosphatase [Gammaproteobacteria bacterium]
MRPLHKTENTKNNRFLISDLCAKLENTNYLTKKEIGNIYKAYLFAAEAHKQQTRHSGEPFIYHPITVASILTDLKMDSYCIIAAMLHDVVEDTLTSKEQIKKEFGKSVANLVDGVTKLTNIQLKTDKEKQAANFRKMILAMAKDIRVIIIKLADRLHNIRTIYAVQNSQKRKQKITETLEIYAPLANRLGMHSIKNELESLCFQALYPDRYRILKKSVQKILGKNKNIIRQAEILINDKLQKKNIDATIIGRQKELYSIYKKMRQQKISFKDISDILGIRIITKSIDDCYLALGIVHQTFTPIPGRFKDYISCSKTNSYQSLHTTVYIPRGVAIEIQIRTNKMHEIADQGIAAHWQYKQKPNDKETGVWLSNLKQIQNQDKNSIDFLENMKSEIIGDEVFVFSPKGELYTLQYGSCVLDFAYAIHSDIGNTSVGSFVDNKRKPLSYMLSNGQNVKIICNKNSHPQQGWLDFVITGRARSAITYRLKKQHKKISLLFGKFLFKRALDNIGVKNVPKNKLMKILNKFGFKNRKDFYLGSATGDKDPQQVAEQIAKNLSATIKNKNTPVILDKDKSQFLHYSKCCKPIPGDKVQGFIGFRQGLIIHRTDCKQIKNYQNQPDSWVDVQWDKTSDIYFPTEICVHAKEKRGVLAGITNILHKNNVNIENIKFPAGDDLMRIMVFSITTTDVKFLKNVIEQVTNIKDVINVSRKLGE